MDSRIALVTNALAFAGPPAVDALIAAGFIVVAHDRAFADAATRDSWCAAHPTATTTAIDDPAALVAHAWSMHGRLDAVVSNDVYPAIHGPIADADLADLTATFDRLVAFPFALARALAPRLRDQGRGNLVFITSARTELPMPGGAIPDIARAGANALVRSLAIELAPHGIAVNAIAPNFLYSEAYFPRARYIDDPAGREWVRRVVPAGRLGEPAEIGALVRYLATLEGSFHTGSIIPFTGGWPAAPPRPD
jgi:NAD(P)-dependent dehydrogenase (short-subunit alcohol dehydrogenase family)